MSEKLRGMICLPTLAVNGYLLFLALWRREDRQKLLDILKTNPESYEIEYYKIFAGLYLTQP